MPLYVFEQFKSVQIGSRDYEAIYFSSKPLQGMHSSALTLSRGIIILEPNWWETRILVRFIHWVSSFVNFIRNDGYWHAKKYYLLDNHLLSHIPGSIEGWLPIRFQNYSLINILVMSLCLCDANLSLSCPDDIIDSPFFYPFPSSFERASALVPPRTSLPTGFV